MKEKKKIFWIIGLSLILLTICIIGIIVIKNIYMKDKYIDEDGKATTIDTPQGDVYEEAKYPNIASEDHTDYEGGQKRLSGTEADHFHNSVLIHRLFAPSRP